MLFPLNWYISCIENLKSESTGSFAIKSWEPIYLSGALNDNINISSPISSPTYIANDITDYICKLDLSFAFLFLFYWINKFLVYAMPSIKHMNRIGHDHWKGQSRKDTWRTRLMQHQFSFLSFCPFYFTLGWCLFEVSLKRTVPISSMLNRGLISQLNLTNHQLYNWKNQTCCEADPV